MWYDIMTKYLSVYVDNIHRCFHSMHMHVTDMPCTNIVHGRFCTIQSNLLLSHHSEGGILQGPYHLPTCTIIVSAASL